MAMADVHRFQDFLGVRLCDESLTLTASRSRQKPPPIPNPSPNPINSNGSNSRRRKRSPVGLRPKSGVMVVKSPGKNLVMEEVKILKRGEAVNGGIFSGEFGDRIVAAKIVEKSKDFLLGTTKRLVPEPETVNHQGRVRNCRVSAMASTEAMLPVETRDLYAGSAVFIGSPPPSSVPVPAFLRKNRSPTSVSLFPLLLDFAAKSKVR